MIGICASCGNYDWDKIVTENEVICPKCGCRWGYKRLPVYFISGFSGVGKTTAVQLIQQKTDEFVCLDADMFYNLMKPDTDEGYAAMVEQVLSLSKNISQCGKSAVWAMAGNLDKLAHAYGARFFSEIRVLALTVDEAELRRRMTEGRGITDPNWIQSSVDYNHYFRTHEKIGDTPYEWIDCTGCTPDEAAEYLQISKRTVLDLARRGDIPAQKVGGRWRFSPSQLASYMGITT